MGPAIFPRILSCLLVLAAGAEAIKEHVDWRKVTGSEEATKGKRAPRELFKSFLDNQASVCVFSLAALSLLYVFGLAYIGFYVSTSVYILVSVAMLCYFTEKETWHKNCLRIGIPMMLIILGLLAAAHKYMHIYFPSKGILW